MSWGCAVLFSYIDGMFEFFMIFCMLFPTFKKKNGVGEVIFLDL